jgi:hypothetical protein
MAAGSAAPIDDDDSRTGAPSMLHFPRVAYDMAAAACRLEDISNTSDLKTNEKPHEARRLFRVTLEQQVESSAFPALCCPLQAVPADSHRQQGLLRCAHPADRRR